MARQLDELCGRWQLNIEAAELPKRLDENDELSSYRQEFLFPKCSNANRDQVVYMCGNSLGLQPKRTRQYLNDELDKWAEHGVDGHFVSNLPWVSVDETCIRQMAHIVGAHESEIAIMNSLTVNLHLMMVAFYRPSQTRYRILIESKAFPSDYVSDFFFNFE